MVLIDISAPWSWSTLWFCLVGAWSILVGVIVIKLFGLLMQEMNKELTKSMAPSVYPIWNFQSLFKWISLFHKDTMTALQQAKQLRGNTFRINLLLKDLYITYEPELVAKYVSKEWERMLDFYEPTSSNMKQLISLKESVIPYKKHINKHMMNRNEIEFWMQNQVKNECETYLKNLHQRSLNTSKSQNINLTKEIQHLLFRCLLQSFVGSKHILKNSKQFQNNFLFLLKNFNNKMIKIESKLNIKLPKYLQFGILKKYNTIKIWFNQMINDSYSELSNANNNDNSNNSYLKTLIDNPLRGRENDTSHVFAMLYGATVNTIPTIILATFLIHLPENRHILMALYQFLDGINGSNNNYNLWEFDYLDQILNEILRLYPVRLITRVTKCDIKLGHKYNDIIIPKKSWFIMSPYLIHRDSNNYQLPNKFLPNRWINEKYIRQMKLNGKYMNFGFGKHSCMGQRFATMLFKTFFIHFFQNYYLKFDNINDNSFDVIYHSKKRGFKYDIFGKLKSRYEYTDINTRVYSELTHTQNPLNLVILVGPSGVGKNTMINWILSKYPKHFYKVVSHTTRNARKNESNGIDYHFIDKSTFEQNIKDNLFIEYENVHNDGNYYGTSKNELLMENNNKIALLDINYQGALTLSMIKQLNDKSINNKIIFMTCNGGVKILEKRLCDRGTENKEQIEQRLNTAKKEFDFFQINQSFFDFVSYNDHFTEAYNQFLDQMLKWFPWIDE